jgi:phospholipid/cholesterol/gamma-HCH transport system substrate-binding protein
MGIRNRLPKNVSPVKLGVAFVVLSLVAGVALFQKNAILTYVKPGATIPIEFSQDYGLRQFISKVKVAGVPVGTVKSVERVGKNRTEVEVKVDDDVPAKLGATPSAAIRPATMLGGNYYIDLKPGGAPGTFDGTIPRERTKTPVELSQVASALQPDARKGIRTSIRDLESTLSGDGSAALRELTRQAPGTLEPAAAMFNGLRGSRPSQDLPQLVGGLESTSRVLATQQHNLGGTIRDLRATADVLSDRGQDMAETLHGMPATLDSADHGLARLHTTIGKLTETADPARPAVRELGTTLRRLDPALAKTAPLARDMRTVLAETRPMVNDLTPASQRLTSVLNDVRGPVLGRVNGPIMNTVNSPYRGTGRYEGSGSARPLYAELGYMVSNLDRATMADKNGSMISFLAGMGPGSVAGLPISLEQMFRTLAGGQQEVGK